MDDPYDDPVLTAQFKKKNNAEWLVITATLVFTFALIFTAVVPSIWAEDFGYVVIAASVIVFVHQLFRIRKANRYIHQLGDALTTSDEEFDDFARDPSGYKRSH